MGTPRRNNMKSKFNTNKKTVNPVPSEWSYRSKDTFQPITYNMISPEIQARLDANRNIKSLKP